jgi:site-specific DNA-cytosine methylase
MLTAHDRHTPPDPELEIHRETNRLLARCASALEALVLRVERLTAVTAFAGNVVNDGSRAASAPNEHEGHLGPNAVKLSELAGTILQGFPENWVFAGKTKRSRWSQIGQAMPPPMAEAVGRSIAAALRKTAVVRSVEDAFRAVGGG